MECKICKIPLIDTSYYLDMYGSKVKKEEVYCPNEDRHEAIVEKRLEKYPTRCPICDSSYNVDSDSNVYKNKKGEIVISVDFSCPCGFNWTIIGNGTPIFEEEQLDEYGEYD